MYLMYTRRDHGFSFNVGQVNFEEILSIFLTFMGAFLYVCKFVIVIMVEKHQKYL